MRLQCQGLAQPCWKPSVSPLFALCLQGTPFLTTRPKAMGAADTRTVSSGAFDRRSISRSEMAVCHVAISCSLQPVLWKRTCVAASWTSGTGGHTFLTPPPSCRGSTIRESEDPFLPLPSHPPYLLYSYSPLADQLPCRLYRTVHVWTGRQDCARHGITQFFPPTQSPPPKIIYNLIKFTWFEHGFFLSAGQHPVRNFISPQ